MFDALSGHLQQVFRNLRGLGKISEANVSEALREVRMALLEADVNFKVAKQFVAKVEERVTGEQVIKSFTPAQQIVKIVNEELTELLGVCHRIIVMCQGRITGEFDARDTTQEEIMACATRFE